MHDGKVIFVADDFGMDAETNRAILHAHHHGALQGASLMMGQQATDDAVRRARENPSLQIGWHLHLCDSQPVTCHSWPWGNAYVQAGWRIGLMPGARRLMRREVAAQWELYQQTGLPCAFVNSHHHLHAHPMVYAALLEVLPRPFNGWLRLGRPCFFGPTENQHLYSWADGIFMRTRRRHCPFRCSDTIWGLGRTYRMQAQEVIEAVQRLPEGLHEFYFHPRSKDDADTQCLLELRKCGF
ncbi:MAG TPA: ChbG/HpnK family deacetylase [Verrucomicrobiae bacterium]|nr:ChbG/HpnK family deacetylase [Verrucomicrobiae bacterium]